MIRRLFIAAFLIVAGSALGGSMLMLGVGNDEVATLSITIPSNWGTLNCSSATSCAVTSSTQTLTVPGGSSGVIKFTISNPGVNTCQYSKNGGTFTTFTTNTTVTFANGDTLALKISGLTPISSGNDSNGIQAIDNTTTSTIGTFDGGNSHA